MTTEQQKLFVRMMTLLFQAQQFVTDLFFKNRLDESIEHTINRHIQYWTHPSQESGREYVNSLKDLERVIQEIIYLEKGDIVRLTVSREQVLQYLLNFIREIKPQRQVLEIKEVITKPTQLTPSRLSPTVSSEATIQKSSQSKGGLTKTQKNILDFVRREPDCRTKDVVNQFSTLSQRTVKRGLRELNEEGRVIKRSDGVAVYYSVT